MGRVQDDGERGVCVCVGGGWLVQCCAIGGDDDWNTTQHHLLHHQYNIYIVGRKEHSLIPKYNDALGCDTFAIQW